MKGHWDVLADLLPASADTAHVVARVYSVSLLACLPVALALLIVGLSWRHRAAAHATVWRCAIAAVVAVCAAQALPLRTAWVLPRTLAGPLVALEEGRWHGSQALASVGSAVLEPGTNWPALVLAIYLIGLVGTVAVIWRGERAARVIAQAGSANAGWGRLMGSLGVPVLESRWTATPFTWGVRRPVIVMPANAHRWTVDERRAALIHELAHVRRGDVAFRWLANVARTVLWFHPAVWLATQRSAVCAELACDDAVLASGVRPSLYARLLMRVCDEVTRGTPRTAGVGMVAFGRGPLRERLRHITRDARPTHELPRRRLVVPAVALCLSLPLGAVHLAPTRAALTDMLQRGAWEARAYAVARLAERPDSIHVARAAARNDPSPRVRAAATRALAAVVAPAPRS